MDHNAIDTAPIDWVYTTEPLKARCRLAKDPCTVIVELSADQRTEFPDVCDVDRLLRQHLEGDTTAEELAVWCRDTFRFTARVVLRSHSHGDIVCTARLPL